MEKASMLLEKTLAAGASKAFILPVQDIPFDPALRAYCEANACGAYGRNHGCPPSVGTPDEVIAQARTYENALIFQTISELEDSFDFEGMMEASARHKKLTADLYEDAKGFLDRCLPLSAGACPVCEKCAKIDDEPCRFPDKMIASLETYCVNVSQLANKCGMKYTNGANTVTYFSAILF